MDGQIVKYCGRDLVVSQSDPLFVKTIQSFHTLVDGLNRSSTITKKSEWKQLKLDVEAAANSISNPNNCNKRFAIEILDEAIVPYLNKIQNQIFVDSDRFIQLQTLLAALAPSYDSSDDHPSKTLLIVDSVIVSINSKKGLLGSSELSKSLQRSCQKQWQPIINDNRKALLNIGARLVAVGAVEIVGKWFLMLWPLYFVVLDALVVIRSIEEKKGLSPVNVMKLGKSFLLLFAALKLLALFSLFTGIGYTCLIGGGITLLISMSDDMLKQSAPIISPHLLKLTYFVDKMYALEGRMMNTLSAMDTTNTGEGCQPQTAPTARVSSRVEELSQSKEEEERKSNRLAKKDSYYDNNNNDNDNDDDLNSNSAGNSKWDDDDSKEYKQNEKMDGLRKRK